jgi:hypothetical protein
MPGAIMRGRRIETFWSPNHPILGTLPVNAMTGGAVLLVKLISHLHRFFLAHLNREATRPDGEESQQ